MSLRTSDKVIVIPHPRAAIDHGLSRKGKVLDLKWNLVLVVFEDGERDWIDSRLVRKQ